jgi:hypothetical protein
MPTARRTTIAMLLLLVAWNQLANCRGPSCLVALLPVLLPLLLPHHRPAVAHPSIVLPAAHG